MQHLIGKTLTEIRTRKMAGYDTYKDLVTWEATTLVFEGGEEIELGGADTEVYDIFEYHGWDEATGPIPVAFDGSV